MLRAALLLLLLLAAPAMAQQGQRPAATPPAPPAVAATPPVPERPVPYEPQLLQLAEILGALAHLTDLCTPQDSGGWRTRALELLEAEGTSPARRERIAGAYNRGYRGWQAMHRRCTDHARLAIERYLSEGQALARDITSRYSD
jgi:uncharacterized protein (TIGR02301 family)